MASSEVKAKTGSDVTPVGEDTLDFDDDTLKGEFCRASRLARNFLWIFVCLFVVVAVCLCVCFLMVCLLVFLFISLFTCLLWDEKCVLIVNDKS